jgi:hypothetical protein
VHFFNLPVTAGEKLVNAIVVLATLMIAFHIIMVAGTYAGYYLLRPAFNMGANMFVIDGMSILKSSVWFLEGYLLFAAAISVFLFGSIYFKRNAFWKTLLSGLVFLSGIALYSLCLYWIAFRRVENSLYWGNYDNSTNINLSHYLFFPNYEYIIPIIITLFFLSLTYLRLKETEV